MPPSATSATPYDRHLVAMAPPPPPPPLHGRASAIDTAQDGAFANLLYDLSCNVLATPQQNNPPPPGLITEMAGLSVTPRSGLRTNRHSRTVAGTMPRLSSAKSEAPLSQVPPTVATSKLRNGNGNGAVSVTAVISSSPDTEMTTNSASASYSGDSESEEKEPPTGLMSLNESSIYSVGANIQDAWMEIWIIPLEWT